MQEPLSNELVFGEKPSIAIVTLWTPVQLVAKRLDKKQYGIIGNLYNAERGLDLLVRSLLAKPEITHLVVTGSDMAKSGQVLHDFFKNGFSAGQKKDTGTKCWKITSEFEGYIELDIPGTALEELRQSISFYRWELTTPFESITFHEPSRTRQKQSFEKKESFVKTFFSEPAGFVFRANGFLETWFTALDHCVKFGQVLQDQKGLFGTVLVLTPQPNTPLLIPEFLSFSQEDVEKQSRVLLSKLGAHPKENQSISFEIQGIPVEFRIQKIVSGWLFSGVVSELLVFESAQLMAVLQKTAQSPTLQSGQSVVFLLQVEKLVVPQIELARAAILIESEYAKIVTPPRLLRDWRGNYVIYLSQGEIVVEHVSPSNELLWMYTGKNALELRDQLMRERLVGTIAHALYLGTELQKAEIALQQGLTYIQDTPLDWTKKTVQSK